MESVKRQLGAVDGHPPPTFNRRAHFVEMSTTALFEKLWRVCPGHLQLLFIDETRALSAFQERQARRVELSSLYRDPL
jgi:hypothetical protein